jgi:hypothetical protein
MGLSLGMKLEGFVPPAGGAKPVADQVDAAGGEMDFEGGDDAEDFDDESEE